MPVDTAILSVFLEGDPNLTTYLIKLLRTSKPEQQDNTLWYLTPENPRKTEDHTPIQTRILKELHKVKDKKKPNPKDDTKFRI